ncbi:heparinase II/III family protein [Candidatus Babeliales bacterium]|nr:heparinase II/III family protein [Candidatus Babeliales bacterium]
MIKKILYIPKRIYQLGLIGTIKRTQSRINKKLYKLKWQKKALSFKANHNWNQISKKHDISANFKNYFKDIKEKKFIDKIFNHKDFQSFLPSKKDVFKHAENSTKNCFNILGSGNICFKKNKIKWCKDFSIDKSVDRSPRSSQVPHFVRCIEGWENSLDFYQNLKIDFPKNLKFHEYYPDIKIPWELSRFNQTFYLGYAYKLIQKPIYALTFLNQVNSWMKQNPYLLGVNWLCPMEVSIRAINFIWGFYFFKDSKEISLDFWQKLICSLYDHTEYLQNNWETSDKPNNHYLADLIGYFYLCFFFDDLREFEKEKHKTFKKLLQQFDKQILPDGSSYEGSTAYHKLITEIFLHFKLLCGIKFHDDFEKKFQNMINFLHDSFYPAVVAKATLAESANEKEFIQIGDNDSGKILLGIKHKNQLQKLINKTKVVNHYSDFGLTIIKNKKWHITFRHPTFCENQPSGHFHQDQLSITFSVGKIPVLIDPGSYLYTSNSKWRNYFRSKYSHNSFYLKNNERRSNGSIHRATRATHHERLIKKNFWPFVLPVRHSLGDGGSDFCVSKNCIEGFEQPFSNLFQLNRKTQTNNAQIKETNEFISIQNFNTEYKKKGLIQNRKIIFFKRENILEIIDWWKIEKRAYLKQNSEWIFIFHPKIIVTKINKNSWLLKHEKKNILTIKSTLEFELKKGFYSPQYGKIKNCAKLCAVEKLSKNKQTTKFKYHKN